MKMMTDEDCEERKRLHRDSGEDHENKGENGIFEEKD